MILRKITAFLIVAALCIVQCMPVMSIRAYALTQSGYCGAYGDGKNVTWSSDNMTYTLTISGNGDMENFTESYPMWWFGYKYILFAIINDGVTSIGENAFIGLINLREVEIPDSVKTIGKDAFIGCENLDLVTFESRTPPKILEKDIFKECYKLRSIKVPAGTKDKYVEALGVSANIVSESEIPVHQHNSDKWTTNEKYHWRICKDTDCKEQYDKDEHTWDTGTVTKEPTTEEKGIKTYTCTVCNYKKTEEISSNPPVHSLEPIEAKAATCTEEGNKKCWYCSKCKKYFTDEAGLTEMTDEERIIPAKGHTWDKGTKNEAGDITYTCTACGETKTDTHTHTWDSGKITKEPTMEETGEKTYTCTVCGKTKTESVDKLTPDKPNSVDISVDNNSGIDIQLAPDAINNFLDDTDNGHDVDIVLEVKGMSGESVSESDKAAIFGILGSGEKVEMYFDISFYKIIDNNISDKKQLTDSTKPISMTVTVPDGIYSADKKYTVVRVHDGKAEKLINPALAQKDLTLSTDKFSVYALVSVTESPVVPEVNAHRVNVTVSGRGTAYTNKSSAIQGEAITVTAIPEIGCLIEGIYVDGERISGSTFIMPDSDVTVRVVFREDGSRYFAAARPRSYIYSYTSDMKKISVDSAKASRGSEKVSVKVELGIDYAGKSATLYKGRNSAEDMIETVTLDENGCYTFEVDIRKTYSLVVEDQ